MKKKKSPLKKIIAKPLPPLPKNLSKEGYRYIANALIDLREHFRQVLESQKKL